MTTTMPANSGRGTVVSPSTDDDVVAALSEVVGGPIGRYSAAPVVRAWVTRALVVSTLLAGATMGLALLLRQHCRTTLWKAPDQFTHLCYSDIPALFSSGGLGDGVTPYLEASDSGYLTQPVGTGGLLYLIGLITPGGRDELRSVFDVATLLLTGCLIASVVLVGLLAGRRAWDAALLAASPVVAFSALINLDLAAIACALGGVFAFSRRRPLIGGLLAGLAMAIRPFEVVLVIAVLIVAYRRGNWATAGPFGIAALLGFVAVNAPVFLAAHQGWKAYWATLWRSDISYGSLLLAPQVLSTELNGKQLPSPSLWIGAIGLVLALGYLAVLFALPAPMRADWRPRDNRVLVGALAAVVVVPMVAIAFGARVLPHLASPVPASAGRVLAILGYPLVVALVIWIARKAPRTPRIAPLALMLACGWMVVSPGVPVQAGLLLLPLIVLTLPRWRVLLTWAAIEVAYGALTWLYLYGLSVASRGTPGWLYLVVLFARVGVTIWLFWKAWLLTWWPSEDVIRRDLGHDPLAGQLADEVPAAAVLEVAERDARQPAGHDLVEADPETR